MYKLLICDDESLERVALRKIIERHYANIIVLDDAQTGEDALKKVHLYQPDILLMDIKMPEMNGLDAQRKILEFQPKIKTVIITAYSDFSYAQEAVKCQVADFLLKPVPPHELYECLDRIAGEISPAAERPEGVSDSAIKKALDYMHSHYLEGLRIADVAEKVNLSEKYFSRYFRQRTGRSFTDQINVLLVAKAKQLLLNSNDPIYKIAMDLGFSDVAYFIKVFRKYEAMTPAKFRQARDRRL